MKARSIVTTTVGAGAFVTSSSTMTISMMTHSPSFVRWTSLAMIEQRKKTIFSHSRLNFRLQDWLWFRWWEREKDQEGGGGVQLQDHLWHGEIAWLRHPDRCYHKVREQDPGVSQGGAECQVDCVPSNVPTWHEGEQEQRDPHTCKNLTRFSRFLQFEFL